MTILASEKKRWEDSYEVMIYTREKESPCKHCTRVISVKNINQHDQRERQARFEQCAHIKTNRNKDNSIIYY